MRVTRTILLLVAVLASASAWARLEITVTGGSEGALPIAVVPFGVQAQTAPLEDVAAVIGADLARSGRFAPLPRERLPAEPHDGREVDFSAWRATGSDTLVVGKVTEISGRYQVQFQVLDTLRGSQITGYVLQSSGPQLRRLAHQIADIIYEKLTGERGAFNTHIAYVMQDEVEGKQRYRLAVADSDGFNEQIILTSPQPLMSPAWSPEGKRLAYVSFEANRTEVFVQNVATGARDKLAAFAGINSAPAWSPDGRRLAMTLSKDGNPEIYVMTLANRELRRVTDNYAIDTEPTWTPDGNALLFTSDRGGRPQIYRVELGPDGAARGRPRRITFEGRYNARAVVSPDGRHVVTVQQTDRGFQIAVLDQSTGNVRVLTDSQLDESPSFAPNGRMIIYATEQAGRGVLQAVSIDGRARQRLGLSHGDVREPVWSPFSTE